MSVSWTWRWPTEPEVFALGAPALSPASADPPEELPPRPPPNDWPAGGADSNSDWPSWRSVGLVSADDPHPDVVDASDASAANEVRPKSLKARMPPA